MCDNLRELLASSLDLEKPLSELCVLSESEDIYRGLIKCSFKNSDIIKYIDSSGSYITSNYFSIGSPSYCSCRFTMYPNGKGKVDKGKVSITIKFYRCLPENAWVEGAICVLGESSKKFSSGGAISSIDIDEFDETLRLKKLAQYAGDNTVIQCYMKMKVREVKCDFDGSKTEYAESRKFNSYKESLFKEKCFYDVTFHLQDGEVKGHKAILAKVPYFKELFDNNDSEQSIELLHIKYNIFTSVLNFLYTGDIPSLDFRLASELYIVSHDLRMYDLKNICSSYLGSNLTEENVFVVTSLAHKYEDMQLKKTCIKFIQNSDVEKLANRSIVL